MFSFFVGGVGVFFVVGILLCWIWVLVGGAEREGVRWTRRERQSRHKENVGDGEKEEERTRRCRRRRTTRGNQTTAAAVVPLSLSSKTKSLSLSLTCPSGVSAGHIIPQSVLCSCRGLASLPSRPIGELTRRRCDSVEA